MRAVAQRVRSARVTVEGEATGAIGLGLLVYLGVTHDDTSEEARWLARKLAELRVFEGAPVPAEDVPRTRPEDPSAHAELMVSLSNHEAGAVATRAFERSLLDVGGAALVVSQFTLYAGTRRGRRPSFTDAARPEVAAPLVEAVLAELAALGVPVAGGRFGAHMLVESTNDGPVTILLDSRDRERPRRK